MANYMEAILEKIKYIERFWWLDDLFNLSFHNRRYKAIGSLEKDINIPKCSNKWKLWKVYCKRLCKSHWVTAISSKKTTNFFSCLRIACKIILYSFIKCEWRMKQNTQTIETFYDKKTRAQITQILHFCELCEQTKYAKKNELW